MDSLKRAMAATAAVLCLGASAQESRRQEPVFPSAITGSLDTSTAQATQRQVSNAYTLGPEDTLSIRVLDMEELGSAPYAIDLRGNISLPRVGLVHAAGLTVDQLQAELTARFREFLQNPSVSILVADYHSQPVLILGAVTSPGVRQIRGNKTLFEVISESGGLSANAGSSINITRREEWGKIPLPNAHESSDRAFTTAEVNIRSVMDAKNPQENIPIKPNDIITVPKAQMVYVLGSVKRPGGFVLSERPNLSVMEALAMAEGLDSSARATKARILRPDPITRARSEIPINVKKIMNGDGADAPLLANDILFIPRNTGKAISNRAIDSMVALGTGLVIYGRL